MNSIKHYQSYPSMRPWIGSFYDSNDHQRLLLVGESHYLPEDSTIQLNVDRWYASNESMLTDEEIEWIYTRGVVRDCIQTNFGRRGYTFFRNPCDVLAAFLDCSRVEALDHIAFMNFYQRPAEEQGESINVTRKDIIVARDVLAHVVDEIQPDLVFFASSSAGKNGEPVLDNDISFATGPHPATSWWNRPSSPYSGHSGKEFFYAFLNHERWIYED